MQTDVRAQLAALMAPHVSGPTFAEAEDTGEEWGIWARFPAGRRHAKAATTFIADVERTFDVFLTEEEWEHPTFDELVALIEAKRRNPAASKAAYGRESDALRKGTIITFAFYNLVVVLLFLFFDAEDRWNAARVRNYVLIWFGLNLFLVFFRWADNRRRSPWRPAK